MKRIWVLATLALTAAFAAGCGASQSGGGSGATGEGGGTTSGGGSSGEKIQVTTTLTVLGSMAEEVGGDRVEVTSVLSPGAAPHTFRPSPSDAELISNSEVVFSNGLGVDNWLGGLIEDAGSEGLTTIELSEGFEPIKSNPHLWLAVPNAKRYVEKMRDALIQVDPEGEQQYRDNAREYLAQLDELDGYIRQQTENVPQDRRQLITHRNPLPYFAEEYGYEVVGVVQPNPNAQPSNRKVAKLVDTVEEKNIPAIFTEVQATPGATETIGQEAGVEVNSLYTGALTEDDAGDNYVDMMRTNIDRIVVGLQ
jgi:ABC-type Zn uptake system ZnuABC Zn-binding protein ZnuA